MPAPREEKSPSPASLTKMNQAAEATAAQPAAAQNFRQANESESVRKPSPPVEQEDAGQIPEYAGSNVSSKLKKDGPSHREIESVAYGIYLQRGGAEGSALEDWLQAERQLMEAFEPEPEKSEKTRAQGA